VRVDGVARRQRHSFGLSTPASASRITP
jgi:hypothetical protein